MSFPLGKCTKNWWDSIVCWKYISGRALLKMIYSFVYSVSSFELLLYLFLERTSTSYLNPFSTFWYSRQIMFALCWLLLHLYFLNVFRNEISVNPNSNNTGRKIYQNKFILILLIIIRVTYSHTTCPNATNNLLLRLKVVFWLQLSHFQLDQISLINIIFMYLSIGYI